MQQDEQYFFPIDLDEKKSKLLLWKRRSSAIKLKAGHGILHTLTIKILRCSFSSPLKGVHNAMAVSNHKNSVPKFSFVFTGVHSEQVQQVALNLPSYRGQLISFKLYKRQSYFAFPRITVSLSLNAQSRSIQHSCAR